MINQTAPDTTNDLEEVLEGEALSDLKAKSVGGAASYMARTMILQLIGIFAGGILAARLSPSDYGTYAIVSPIIAFLTFFSDIGFGSALIQKKNEPTVTEYRTVFTVQQALSWFIFACTLFVAGSGLYPVPISWEGKLLLLALGISFPIVSLKTISSIKLERKLEFDKLVLPQIFEYLVYNGVLVLLAIKGFGVMAFFYAVLLRAVAGVVAMWIQKPWPIGFELDRKALKELIGNGSKFQLNDLLARIKDQGILLILPKLMTQEQLGYISLSQTFSMLPYQLTVQNVISITFPTYTRLQHDKKLLSKAIEKTLFFISLLIFPLLVGMCVFIFPLTTLIPDYQKWKPALLTFVLLTFSIGWGAISTPLTNTLNAIGELNTTLKLMVMWTTLNWILTPLLCWRLGFNGFGISTFIISFTSIASIYFVKKVIPLDVWEQVWRQLLAAGIMTIVGVAGLHVWERNFVLLVAGMMLAGAGYGLTLLVIGRSKLLTEVHSLLGAKAPSWLPRQ